MGFIRDKRLHRYYMSNQDAFRLKLLLPPPADIPELDGSAAVVAGVEQMRVA